VNNGLVDAPMAGLVLCIVAEIHCRPLLPLCRAGETASYLRQAASGEATP